VVAQICLETFKSRAEAEIVRSVLADSGIRAWTTSDDAGGVYPMLAFSHGVKVWVDFKDAGEAWRVLAHAEGSV